MAVVLINPGVVRGDDLGDDDEASASEDGDGDESCGDAEEAEEEVFHIIYLLEEEFDIPCEGMRELFKDHEFVGYVMEVVLSDDCLGVRDGFRIEAGDGCSRRGEEARGSGEPDSGFIHSGFVVIFGE